MAIDLNDAPEQREFGALPDGTFVRLEGHMKKGGANHPADKPGDPDLGIYKNAKAPSDVLMIEWEFIVTHGLYKNRKVFQFMVVDGGERDDNGRSKAGEISRGMLKAMVNSAMGLDPKDESAETKAKRIVPNMVFFDGIPFAAHLGVEESEGYSPKNFISRVLQPGDEEYQSVIAGQDVPAKPLGVRHSKGGGRPVAAASAGTPTWQRDAAPAVATPAAPAVQPRWGNGTAAPASQAQPAQAPAEAPPAAAPAAGGPSWLSR